MPLQEISADYITYDVLVRMLQRLFGPLSHSPQVSRPFPSLPHDKYSAHGVAAAADAEQLKGGQWVVNVPQYISEVSPSWSCACVRG